MKLITLSWPGSLLVGLLFTIVARDEPETKKPALPSNPTAVRLVYDKTQNKPHVHSRATDTLTPSDFLSPPVNTRPGAFWSWLNGSITSEQITRDLEEMKRGGMKGGEIWDVAAHADPDNRIPAGPPFLGPESTQLIVHAIREADRLGLEIGIVASSGWNAGGSWVPPEHAGKALYHSTTTITGPTKFKEKLPLPELPKLTPRGDEGNPSFLREVAVLAIKSDSPGTISSLDHILDLTEKTTPDGTFHWDVPDGQWTILRFICTNHGQLLHVPSPNSSGPMIDFFDPTATEFHLGHITSTILNKLGRDSFEGTSFKTLEFDSMELAGFTPWTEKMAEEFQRRAGYPIRSYLPLLAGWKLADKSTQETFLYDWQKVVSDLLIESHYATASAFLKKIGVSLIAEAGGPGPPIWNSNPVEAITALGAADIPRGEFWIRHQGIFLVKSISSAAHVYDKRIVDAEAFTTWRRWVDGPLDHKDLADRALAEGLNNFSMHTFASSPPEAGLPGWAYHAGTDINPSATWWPMVRPFMDYLARCSYMLRQGWFVADVCYYFGDQAPNFYPASALVPEKPLLDGLHAGHDYDVCSSQVILERMTVENGRITLPCGMSYAALVLPPQNHIPLPVYEKIRELIAAGGTVIADPLPTRAPGLHENETDTQAITAITADLTKIKHGEGRVILTKDLNQALHKLGVAPAFGIVGREPGDLGPLDFVNRRTNNDTFYFIRNKTREPITLTGRFRVDARSNSQTPEFWWPHDGSRTACPEWKSTDDGLTELPITLGPLGSVFVVFRKDADTSLEPLSIHTFVPSTSFVLDGPWKVEFPEGWGAPPQAEFPQLHCWTESSNNNIRLFSGIATYHKSFVAPESLLENNHLVLELGDLAEIAEVSLNGENLGITWLPPFRVDATGKLRPGTNHLEIRVANLWANRLNGDSLLPEEKRFTRSNIDRIQTDPTSDSSYGKVPRSPVRPTYTQLPPLMKSGLIGPVRIITPRLTDNAQNNNLPLAGEWRFQLDADLAGVEQKWHSRKLNDTITLPGTTDEAKKGPGRDESPTDRLARPWAWVGPAWYQREVTIPDSWRGKRITLHLERTKHCRVWLGDTFIGWDNTLSAPQVFDLTKVIEPGTHTLTVLIDNSKLPPVGPSHQVDERTQTNWNGIVGNMELRATDPIWIKDAQVFPDATKKEARVRVVVGNITGSQAAGKIKVTCRSYNVDQPTDFAATTVQVNPEKEETVVEFTYQPGENVPLWDEFQPAMLKLGLTLESMVGEKTFTDIHSVNFGMRDVTTDYNQLKINGTAVFLRGRLDCANYPLTGYAPMDKKEWRRIYSILAKWGLNHVRFHSWCPPRAAFEAADEMGFYLQPELPNKRSAFNALDSKDAAYHNIDFLEGEHMDETISLHDYARREGELILREFGNHPSFIMFTLGNELGRNPGMFELVKHFKQLDPRHLHAQGANNMHWDPSLAEGDDFWVTGKAGNDSRPLRGSFYIHDYHKGAVEFNAPSTLDDFSKSIEGIPVPLIGHETGQYQVYPDFRDIEKFTGVLKARNYEIFRNNLKKAGMLDQADDFVQASGALSALCYREDIELALRTPGFAGFQLLDIMDFPGQGTALVGMLNVFMESKGVIESEKWREFCAPVVPLLRMKNHTWTTDEVFMGRVEIAHYGPEDFPDAKVSLTITDSKGTTILQHRFDPVILLSASLNDVDLFAWPLNGVKSPQRLDVTLAIEGTKYRNSYPIWVYAPKVDTKAPENVMISRKFGSKETQDHLSAGGKVLLLPELDELPLSVSGAFQTEFWSPMFAKSARKRGIEEPPGTLGLLCDPAHPTFAAFPTESHSNWQWWHLVKNARPIILDETPHDYRPILQVIDNFDRNHKLGLIFETKVGKGSLLVCAIDLPAHQDKPEARQLLHSLQQYTASPAFDPKHEIPATTLHKLISVVVKKQ